MLEQSGGAESDAELDIDSVKYVGECKNRRVRPNKQLLHLFLQPHSFLRTIFQLQLSNNYIGDVGLVCLSRCLPSLPSLQLLGLASNGIGNTGVIALCESISANVLAIEAIDLRKNFHVSRCAGLALLSFVRRMERIFSIELEGTNVTDYFEKRISAHCQRHREKLSGEKEREQFLARLAELKYGPQTSIDDGGSTTNENATTSVAGSLPVREGSSVGGAQLHNQPFDEAWDGFDDGDEEATCDEETTDEEEAVEEAESSANSSPTPPPTGEPIGEQLYVSPSQGMQQKSHRRLIDLQMGQHANVEAVDASPERLCDSSLRDVFANIEQYKPKEIEIPTKFLFPAKIDYLPVVYPPDPMLHPAAPSLLRAKDDAAPNVVEGGTSMYWNFFASAKSGPLDTTKGAQENRALHDDTAEAQLTDAAVADDERQQLTRIHSLHRLNDALFLKGRCLMRRPLCFSDASPLLPSKKTLCELLVDPLWTPKMPTRDHQVEGYCRSKKLKYNVVSADRAKIVGGPRREYIYMRSIKHSLTEKLTSGALDFRGTRVATTSYDMTCKLWDITTGKRLHVFRGHDAHLSDCTWNMPTCDKVITASFDKTLKVWSVATGELLTTLVGHELEVVSVISDNTGNFCASGGMDDIAIVWDLEREAEAFTLTGHSAEVVALHFSPLGDMIASGSMDETVRLWNTTDGTCLWVFSGHRAEVSQVRFNCFGNMVLSSSIDGTCRLWDVKTGEHKSLRGHTREVVDCDFSPDGWLCASASEDGTARVWDVLSGGCLTMMVGHQSGVCRVVFGKSGNELITGSTDSTARVWDVATGESLQVLSGHKGVVVVAYNAYSERIMSLSKDNTCRIWQLEPPPDSMLSCAATAICQHPTFYADIMAGGDIPPNVAQLLERIHRKVFPLECEAVVPPTPIPQYSSPVPDGSTLTEPNNDALVQPYLDTSTEEQ